MPPQAKNVKSGVAAQKKPIAKKNSTVSTKSSGHGVSGYMWAMVIVLIATVAGLYWRETASSGDRKVTTGSIPETTVVASAETEYTEGLYNDVPCGDYSPAIPGCTPTKCARVVVDGLFSADVVDKMKALAEKGMVMGGGAGGPTILDLHTGAVSHQDKFINIYSVAEGKKLFTEIDIETYKMVKDTIRKRIEETFGVSGLHLTNPTFFSRITNKPPKSDNDIYWMPHIDRDTYGSFVYTSLLYLNTYGKDYKGGQFVFLDDNETRKSIVEPRAGRVSFFTSGAENLHHVSKVSEGVRYAITVSFTCDPSQAIADPQLGMKHSD